MLDILLCILCLSCWSIYITSETPKSGSSKVVATKKVSPRKCSPRLGVVSSEDEDDSSDIGEDTIPEVFPSSPISLLSKGTYATHWCILWLEIKIYGVFFSFLWQQFTSCLAYWSTKVWKCTMMSFSFLYINQRVEGTGSPLLFCPQAVSTTPYIDRKTFRQPEKNCR